MDWWVSVLKNILAKPKKIQTTAYAFFSSDNDSDGVDDINDLDDDNDGILDEIENTCAPVSGYDAYWSYEGTTDDVSINGKIFKIQLLKFIVQ